MYQETKEFPATETKHPCLIVWRKRAIEAKIRGYFLPEERTDAAGWRGCAIGEARKQGFFELIEPKWLRLGYEFSVAVDDNDFVRCYEIIKLIEEHMTNANA